MTNAIARRVAAPLTALALGLCAAGPAALAPLDGARAAPPGTGLPLPRFVSLRAGEVNMRAGPGVQYPVEWVYRRQNLPLEVFAEYRAWRRVRDWRGAEGWIHQGMLSSRRTAIVAGDTGTLRAAPSNGAEPVARAEPGVVAQLLECPGGSDWCQVEVAGHRGWTRREALWGVYPREVVK
ncbi:MAG: SH3 domain-containing protein [Hyphomicrobiales bacterium]|nr:SH3 domain-containing protein [Hyphomicrobiales bacterium]MCP5370145.1 SH3 domain-containing protein [Hyphomicrobiales bacterium]